MTAIRIESGYRPGALGRIVEMHARFYARHSDFGVFFESKVARELADFVTRLDRPCNGLWLALADETVVGSVVIDGEDLGNDRAHLRWFIMDDAARGTGSGGLLLRAAIAFCDARSFSRTHLWTFSGLDAARKLYERAGFALANETAGESWGREVLEQEFVRERALSR